MKKNLGYSDKDVKSVVLYLTFFISALVLVSSLWYFFIDGVLFYCSDKLPLFDLLPPFVHGGPDHFIASPTIVYVFWIGALFLIFMLPGVIMKEITKISTFKMILISLFTPVLILLFGFFLTLFTELIIKLFDVSK